MMKALSMLMVVLMFASSLAACSHRAVYENIRANERLECSKRPPAEYEACIEGLDKSYEDYTEGRQEVIAE